LTATTDTTEAVSESEAVIIVPPLVVDEDGVPDFAALDRATEAVAAGLKPGTLVSYETTLPVHTTRRRLAPRLSELSGLELGRDLFVVHSPERVYSGRIFADLRRYPKLVGGLDDESTLRGLELYAAILDFDDRPDLDRPNGIWPMESAEAAELAKLADTVYRNVNIALANEFAVFSETIGVDVHGVIAAANSLPMSHIHQPGIAVGGHCIPVYPKFYLSNDPSARVPAAAIEANEAMPRHAVDTILGRYGDLVGRKVAVLGATYRGGVKEVAFSGVFPLVECLRAQGAQVVVHDPLFTDEELKALGLTPYRVGEGCDVAVIQADHEEYRSLSATDLPGVQLVYDGRGVLSADRWSETIFLKLGSGT
jgi:nucleotide sugar dehydrogenase